MVNKSKGIDKNILKRIFKEQWGPFKEKYSSYRQKRYDSVVKKMLGCGDPRNGYSTYRCSWCGQGKKAFSCITWLQDSKALGLDSRAFFVVKVEKKLDTSVMLIL